MDEDVRLSRKWVAYTVYVSKVEAVLLEMNFRDEIENYRARCSCGV